LIEQLWKSLTAADIPLDSEYLEELDRRVAALDADLAAGRSAGVPWSDMYAKLRQRAESRMTT
jgi:putative addiction module component (TIGR02574 family)